MLRIVPHHKMYVNHKMYFNHKKCIDVHNSPWYYACMNKRDETKKYHRVFAEVEPDKGRRVKAAAALKGLTMQEWIAIAIDNQLQKEKV